MTRIAALVLACGVVCGRAGAQEGAVIHPGQTWPPSYDSMGFDQNNPPTQMTMPDGHVVIVPTCPDANQYGQCVLRFWNSKSYGDGSVTASLSGEKPEQAPVSANDDAQVTITIECKTHCVEMLEGMQAPSTSDLDRAMEICAHRTTTKTNPANPYVAIRGWQPGWESCEAVTSRYHEQETRAAEMAKAAEKAREAADLAFVKRIAGSP